MDAPSPYRVVPSIVAHPAGVILFLVNADPRDRRVPNLGCLGVVIQVVYSEAQAVTALRELNVHRQEIRRVRARFAVNGILAAIDPNALCPREPVRITGQLAGKLFALHGKHSVERVVDESGLVPAAAIPEAISFVYGRITTPSAVLYGFIDGDMTIGLAVLYASSAFLPVMTRLFFHGRQEAFSSVVRFGMSSFDLDTVDHLGHTDKGLVHHHLIHDGQVWHLPRDVDGPSHVVLRGFPAFYVCELMRLEAGFAPEWPAGMRPIGYAAGPYQAIARENLVLIGTPGPAQR